jgi:hypothetical protein
MCLDSEGMAPLCQTPPTLDRRDALPDVDTGTRHSLVGKVGRLEGLTWRARDSRHGRTVNRPGSGEVLRLVGLHRERGVDPFLSNRYGQTLVRLAWLIATYPASRFFANLG